MTATYLPFNNPHPGVAEALQRGLYELLSDAPLMVKVEIVDNVEDGAGAYPFVVIGNDDIDSVPNSCGDVWDCLCIIPCRDDGIGRLPTKRICDAVMTTLNDCPLSVSGFRVTATDVEGVSFQTEEGGRRHVGLVRYRVHLTAK